MLDFVIGTLLIIFGIYYKNKELERLTGPAFCLGLLFWVFSIFSLMTGQSMFLLIFF